MVDKVLFTSNKEDWETPDDLFEQLDSKYHFKFDLAASAANKKCNNYYSVEDDSLSKQWNKLEGGAMAKPSIWKKSWEVDQESIRDLISM